MFRVLYYFLFIYLIYKGIQFVFGIFAAMNSGKKSGKNSGTTKSKDNVSQSAKSKFKDVEEANYIEIKDDKKKDPQ